MKAMIMAAGYGTRLGKETRDRPKILIDLGGITALEWILGKLKSSGVDEVIMNVHYLADVVKKEGRRIADSMDVDLKFSDETDRLLETGGGLYKARHFFDDKPFVVYNGDIISDLDIQELIDANIKSGCTVTLSTRTRPGDRVFLFDNYGYLVGWRNRKTGEEIITREGSNQLFEFAYSAVAVVKPDIFSIMNSGIYSLRQPFLELSAGKEVNSVVHNSGFWYDIGRPEGLASCRNQFGNHS